MPIQSATALNAYLSSASAGALDAGVSSANSDQDTVDQSGVARQALTPSPDTATQPASEGTEETPQSTLSSIAAGLPALYGRNARSVAAGTGAGSISLIA